MAKNRTGSTNLRTGRKALKGDWDEEGGREVWETVCICNVWGTELRTLPWKLIHTYQTHTYAHIYKLLMCMHTTITYISKVLGDRERLTNKGAAETDGISDEWNAKVQELQRDVKWFHLGYFIWNPRYLWSLFQSKGNEGPIRLSNSPRVTHLAAQIGN